MKVSLSPKAYSKILLHACKYPHKAINGVLIGENSKLGSDAFQIVDVVPLFHQCLGLAAMLEIALAQIDTYCCTNGLYIAGYYQANEHLDNNSPDGIAYKIAEKVLENAPNAVLVMINNHKLDSDCKENALELYQMTEGKWKASSPCNLIGGEASLAVVSELIRSKTYQSLVDFDTHLDDISSDWLNVPINEIIEMNAT